MSSWREIRWRLRGPITHLGANNSNSKLEEWADGYKRNLYKEQPVEAEGHTHISKTSLLFYLYFPILCNLGVVSK